MGQYVGWHCKKCGASNGFSIGGGMTGFNDPKVVEMAKSGELGTAMGTLLAGGIPEGWTLFNENVFYQCPECGGVVSGGAVRVDDGSGNWLVFHIEPEPCASCGGELEYWDDKTPLTRHDLFDRCVEIEMRGCPECGEKAVELDAGNWD